MADIQRKEKEKAGHIVDDSDPVPFITREHFEEALRHSRKSTAKQDMFKYDEFRKKYDPGFNKNKGVGLDLSKAQGDSSNNFNQTINRNQPVNNNATAQDDDDDDL